MVTDLASLSVLFFDFGKWIFGIGFQGTSEV